MSLIHYEKIITGTESDGDAMRLDCSNKEFNWSHFADVATGSFVGTYTVEYTVTPPIVGNGIRRAGTTFDPWAGAVWIPYTGTSHDDDAIVFHNRIVQAVRVNCSAYTSGTLAVTVTQGVYL